LRFLTLILTLVLVVGISPANGANEFRDVRKTLEASFNPERPAKDRLDAVAGLLGFDDRETAELLVAAIGTEDRILSPILERKTEVDERILALLGSQISKQKRTIPRAQSAELRRLRREATKLQDRVDGEMKVFDAIDYRLSTLRSKDAIEWLERSGIKDDSWRARRTVGLVLGEIGSAGSSARPLEGALRDNEESVRAAAALSLGKLKVVGSLKKLIGALKDKSWAVRGAVIEALGTLGEKGAVGALIEHMEKEEETQLLEDCGRALGRLTGMSFGSAVGLWKKWWGEHQNEYGEEGKPLGGHEPKGDGDPGRGYYGIPVTTSNAIFILDISGSMLKSPTDHTREPGAGEKSKIDIAKAELTRVLKNFNRKGKFNVIVFNSIVKAWMEKMTDANEGSKNSAITFVTGLDANSSTNIYDAMELAFKTTGMGARDKHYGLVADTIFLLSDGAPTRPDGSLDDWMKIIRAVREWNKLKRVKIHAIGVGGHNAQFMSMLARENDGKYVSR
jgi:hypothetical protein